MEKLYPDDNDIICHDRAFVNRTYEDHKDGKITRVQQRELLYLRRSLAKLATNTQHSVYYVK